MNEASRSIANRVADALLALTCPYCDKVAPGWSEKELVYARRPLRPGPGTEYHCYEAAVE